MKFRILFLVGLGLLISGTESQARKAKPPIKAQAQLISNCIETNPKSVDAQFKCINTNGDLSLVKYKHCAGMCTAANASCISSCLAE